MRKIGKERGKGRRKEVILGRKRINIVAAVQLWLFLGAIVPCEPKRVVATSVMHPKACSSWMKLWKLIWRSR